MTLHLLQLYVRDLSNKLNGREDVRARYLNLDIHSSKTPMMQETIYGTEIKHHFRIWRKKLTLKVNVSKMN